ncbi:MAG: hypothetical protein GY822_07550 [Deltaproteobacteria bacterium]|nr:hypothetical protein [Deltaproteobacteria bacterium]
MNRKEILSALKRYAFAAEVCGDDRVDGAAISGALWGLRSVDEDLVEMHESGALQKSRHLSNVMKESIALLIDGEPLPFMDEMEASLPAGIFALQNVKGLGAKKIRMLWEDLDVTDLSTLEYACSENRLLSLKGFGEKTQKKIVEQLKVLQANASLRRLDVAMALSKQWQGRLAEVDGVLEIFEAGSLVRRCEVVSDLHFVVSVELDIEELAPQILDLWEEMGAVDAAFDDERTLSATYEGFPVLAYLCFEEEVGGALVWHRASPAHLVSLKGKAESLGATFDSATLSLVEECEKEEELYAALGLICPTPERRESGLLIEKGSAHPRLLERGDIVGALHNHTTASDGMATMQQMHEAATQMGLAYLGISEHSQSAVYAGGLAPGDLQKQGAVIGGLNEKLDGCVLLTSVESDILPDGSLDYAAPLLAELHHVIASAHARGNLDRDAFTERMVRAARSPHTDIIGHPTGRLLLGRAPSDYDVTAFLEACEQSGTAVELNANPARLDLNETHLAEAKERGICISIAADAHSVEALHHLDYGVAIARRAGLTVEDVLNCWDLKTLTEWFQTRRKKAGSVATSSPP